MNFKDYYIIEQSEDLINITPKNVEDYYIKNEKYLDINEKSRAKVLVNYLFEDDEELAAYETYMNKYNLTAIPTDVDTLKKFFTEIQPKTKWYDDEMWNRRLTLKTKWAREEYGKEITLEKIKAKANEYKEYALNQLNMVSNAVNETIKFLKSKYPNKDLHIDTTIDYFIRGILLNMDEAGDKINPVILYISHVNDEYGDIGVSIDRFNQDPKQQIQLFEPNDEATVETYKIVQTLTEDPEKENKVYTSQNSELLMKIKDTMKTPINLYVSPDQKYASGYYDLKGTRDIVSFMIKNKYLRKESDVDWKTSQEAPITKFRYEIYK
jgi:hypothetical protein